MEYISSVIPSTSINYNDNQTEAVVSVNKDSNGNRVITATYNDTSHPLLCNAVTHQCYQQPNHIYFTGPQHGGNRYVGQGASQLGWSYSTNDGSTWTNMTPLAPPTGQAVLWGDPAIATCPGGCTDVFITTLAISQASFDAHAINDPTYGMTLEGAFTIGSPPLDGACVARSTNGGKNFSIQQCLTNSDHFYDGDSVVMTSSAGPIYAAFDDVNTALINVWKSPSPGQPFVRIPSPPITNVATHPRMRADGTRLYLAAQTNTDEKIWMTYWNGSSWSAPRYMATGQIYPNIQFSVLPVRTGPQFSFDIAAFSQGTGSASCQVQWDCVTALCDQTIPCFADCVDGSCRWDDHIRMVYTYWDGQNFKIGAKACSTDLDFCDDVPAWGSANQAGDQYSPSVVAFPGLLFFAGADWHMTYQSRAAYPTGNKVTLAHQSIFLSSSNVPLAAHQDAIPYEDVCPDWRFGQPGYWGDYNNIAFLSLSGTGTPRYIATFTDSFAGCPTQYNFFSKHAHVGTVVVDR